MQMYENFIKVNFDDLEIGDVFLRYYNQTLKWCIKVSEEQIIDGGDVITFSGWSEFYLTPSQYLEKKRKLISNK